MAADLIVLRASPDWEHFDMEMSRLFLRRAGLPDDLVIEFATLWDRSFKADYRTVRAQLKALAEATYRGVHGARLIPHEHWDEASSGPEAWIAFVDDDDWMAPHLFEALGRPSAGHDGARWANVRVGREFADEPYPQGIIHRRPADTVLYTNNYAVTGRAVRRLGRAPLFEHFHAKTVFKDSSFNVLASNAYLSCAVKHPCSTLSVKFLMQRPDFRADPRAEMGRFVDALHASEPLPEDAWLAGPYARFRAIMTDALKPR